MNEHIYLTKLGFTGKPKELVIPGRVKLYKEEEATSGMDRFTVPAESTKLMGDRLYKKLVRQFGDMDREAVADNTEAASKHHKAIIETINDANAAGTFTEALPSYLGFGAGGATLGGGVSAWLSNDGERVRNGLKGAMVGGLLGLLLNYGRRKSYYGDLADY